MLKSIKSKGRTAITERGGKPVARVEASGKTVCLKDLSRLVEELPKLGVEAEALGKDLQEITKNKPPLPPGSPWK